MRCTRSASAAVVALVLFASASVAEETGLPGNASNLREEHGDWQVSCSLVAAPDGGRTKRCALSQEQLAQQTRQRALAIELTPEGNGAKGVLMLPFGLALQHGVTYQLDDREAGAVQHFRTCLPAGCVVDVGFDDAIVASLKGGNVLKVRASAVGGQPMVFSISLTGFSSAYDRVVALAK